MSEQIMAKIHIKKPILNYMNIFRAIAILMIVLSHSIYIGSTTLRFSIKSIFLNGTVLFIFISGFLFKYLTTKLDYIVYLKKKLINVISPYIIISFIGITFCFARPDMNPFNELNPFIQIFIFLTTGFIHNFPTWYIPMITIYFILAPVFLKLEDIHINGKSLLYLLIPIFVILSVIYPKSFVSYKDLIAMTDFSLLYKYWLCIKAILYNFLNLIFAYVLGMFFAAHIDKIKNLYKFRYFLLLLTIVTIGVEAVLAYHSKISISSISKMILSILILTYLEHYDEQIKKHPKFNGAMDLIAKYSFGIFFVHIHMMYLLKSVFKYFGINFVTNVTNWFSLCKLAGFTIVFFIFSLGASLLFCYLIKTMLTKLNIKNTRAFIGA